jgi:hypothetical protein
MNAKVIVFRGTDSSSWYNWAENMRAWRTGGFNGLMQTAAGQKQHEHAWSIMRIHWRILGLAVLHVHNGVWPPQVLLLNAHASQVDAWCYTAAAASNLHGTLAGQVQWPLLCLPLFLSHTNCMAFLMLQMPHIQSTVRHRRCACTPASSYYGTAAAWPQRSMQRSVSYISSTQPGQRTCWDIAWVARLRT